MSSDAALCPAHGTVAIGACTRCGVFVCEECSSVDPAGRLCRSCLARPEVRLGASRRARWALGYALAGFHGLLPLLLVGWWLAHAELRAIEAGLAPPPGRPFAQAARWLGFVGIAGWGAVGLYFASR